MSYLNPITLTPKLYQSTDREAPQLTGAVGDYKSVWKACLVTGYGSKAGAGFTLENEADKSCDFISPNIMMSKIGVEEDNNSYKPYYYQGATKVNMAGLFNTVKTAVKKASWVMLVCELGLYFVITVNGLSQVIYLGLAKSAINDGNKNFVCVNLGNLGGGTSYIFNGGNIGSYTDFSWLSNGHVLATNTKQEYMITLVSDVFWRKGGALLGSQPALLLQNAITLAQETKITDYQEKAVLYAFVCSSYNEYYIKNHNMGVMIYLDDWEF